MRTAPMKQIAAPESFQLSDLTPSSRWFVTNRRRLEKSLLVSHSVQASSLQCAIGLRASRTDPD